MLKIKVKTEKYYAYIAVHKLKIKEKWKRKNN
jgi:hypothetical protein